ncbi:hypothetical protein LCGC14_2768370, partial [marine sediment metagenome]
LPVEGKGCPPTLLSEECPPAKVGWLNSLTKEVLNV